MRLRPLLLVALAVAGPALAEAPPRPAAIAVCTACHTLVEGRNGFGPSLWGVGGRRSASLPGYAYSEALKASGLTWDAATLDRWLSGPRTLVPGTRMPYAGIPDPAKRAEVVAWLMALK